MTDHEASNTSDQPAPRVPVAALGRLFTGLAHDLRTPLTVIRNAVYFLRRSQPRAPEIAEFLDMIDAETQELDLLLQNLAEISEGQDPEPTEVDLESLWSKVSAEMDPRREVSWHAELSIKPPVIWCDLAQFHQVLRHLVRNALTAMKGRGEICLRAWQEGDFDLIEVRDRGPGIPEEVRTNLFEPLVTTKEAGMGLGLTYSREIVQRHGGAITVAESSPHGTAFRISLPRASKE